jgi:NTE family protein
VGTELELAQPQPAGPLATSALQAARRAGEWAMAMGAMFAPLALGLAAPGGAMLRTALLRGLPRPRDNLSGLRDEVERTGATFDGRLRVVAVDRRSGRRVVFGSPGAPRARVPEAVEASCSVPWLFAPVTIAGREYVDGGVWSPTNLDTAPAGRETHVLCLNPAGNLIGTNSLLGVVRNVARSAVSLESMTLRRRGAAVQTIAPNVESAAAMGTNFMDREPRARVLAAGYRQGLAVATPS